MHLFDSLEEDENLSKENSVQEHENSLESNEEDISWELQLIDKEENIEDNIEEKSNKNEDSNDEEIIRHVLDDDTVPLDSKDNTERQTVTANDFQQKTQERFSMLEEFTSKLKKADKIEEFEDEPAYQRKNIQIDDSKPSEQDNISKFGLSDDGNGKFNLRDNNFLHDNVD